MVRDPRRVEVTEICHVRGCRTYIAVDPTSREACVVDPVLDNMRETMEALSSQRARVRYVVDTHAHGDHLSGGAAMHARLGCEYVVHPNADNQCATARPADGASLPLGEQSLTIHHAPGVTHDALVVEAPGALFTGDTLLIGTVGVRDAPGSDGNAWFDTMERLFRNRPSETVVHPGHDDMGRTMTTIRAERTGNRWLREDDREAFLTIYASDTRRAGKDATKILAANRQGLKRAPKDLASAASGFQSPVEVLNEKQRRARGPAQPPSRHTTENSGISPWVFVVSGLAIAGSTVAGWLIDERLHGVAMGVGVILLAMGLFRLERGPRTKRNRGSELYYEGPSKGVPN